MLLKIICLQVLFLIITGASKVKDQQASISGDHQQKKSEAYSFQNVQYILIENYVSTLQSCPSSSSICQTGNYLRFDITLESTLSEFSGSRVQRFRQYMAGCAVFSSDWTEELKLKHIKMINIIQEPIGQIIVSGNIYYESYSDVLKGMSSLSSSLIVGELFQGMKIFVVEFLQFGQPTNNSNTTNDQPKISPLVQNSSSVPQFTRLTIIISAVIGGYFLVMIPVVIFVCCRKKEQRQTEQKKPNEVKVNLPKDCGLSEGEIVRSQDGMTSYRQGTIRPIYLERLKDQPPKQVLQIARQIHNQSDPV